MKKTYRKAALILSILLLVFSLAACTQNGNTESGTAGTATAPEQTSELSVNKDGATVITLNGNSADISGSGAVADGSEIKVTSGGKYEISGTLSDGRITVDADDGEVTLILNGADITCSYSSAIYVYQAKNVTVYVEDGTENVLSDGSSYKYDDNYSSEADEEPNACLYSKDDLVIAGSGTLTVNGNLNNGITGKDTLTIESVNLTVNAKNTGIKGKDDLLIKSGSYTIECESDAIHGDNNTTIQSGTFTLTCSDDGIHADNTVTIENGTYKISGREGIEGTVVIINNGTIDIDAQDDGINAAQKIDGVTPTVKINGGKITINMAQGDTDGIDANGNIEINGGTVYINGQSPFDYDGTATLNGGTVYVNGEQVTELQNQFGGGMGMGVDPGAMGGQPGQMPQGGQQFQPNQA